MQRFNINWTAKTLVNQMKKGNVNFDNAVQRGLVWDINKKSLLIHSMVYGYAIPAMYFTRDENGMYDSLDGKQRSNAISEFMNDEFCLSIDTPPVFDEDGKAEEISGMTFSQLPEWAQDRIKDFSLTIYYYENMTEQEIREFFRRLNNGKPLSAIELTRVNTPCLEKFQELAKHESIQSVVSIAGKKRFTDEMIAMQLYNIVTEENPDFSTKTFREWAKVVKTDEEVIGKIKAGLDMFNTFITVFDLADKKLVKTMKTRTHFISCAYYCYMAVQKEMSEVDVAAALRRFFTGDPTVSDEYNETVRAGSAKPGSVQTRKRIVEELLEQKNENCDSDTPATDHESSTEE